MYTYKIVQLNDVENSDNICFWSDNMVDVYYYCLACNSSMVKIKTSWKRSEMPMKYKFYVVSDGE